MPQGSVTFLDPATSAWISGHLDSLSSYLLARCLHLWHKVLPRWVWEKVPDPANSNSSQPHMEVSKNGLSGTSWGVGDAGTMGSRLGAVWGRLEARISASSLPRRCPRPSLPETCPSWK